MPLHPGFDLSKLNPIRSRGPRMTRDRPDPPSRRRKKSRARDRSGRVPRPRSQSFGDTIHNCCPPAVRVGYFLQWLD